MNKPFGPINSGIQTGAKRDQGRDSLLLKAILRFPSSGKEGEVRIRNLSSGGLMAETPVRVTRGEVVEINLRSIGWVTGHVAWITEGRMGIAFDHPLNPKAARKPVGQSEQDLPPYLKKLNDISGARKIRRA
ncbi:MAG: PilZ domain-containing protein [Sphingorhabdus sp.]